MFADKCLEAIESYCKKDDDVVILVLSVCKFLGDTSHLVMVYMLLFVIKHLEESSILRFFN